MKRIPYIFLIAFGFVLALIDTRAAYCARIVTLKMLRQVPDGIQGEEECHGAVDMGNGITLPFDVEVTAKGNGSFKIANLNLRLIDGHDDGQVYEDGLLSVDLVDMGDNSGKCLIISGIVVHTGEKETDPRMREAVVFIYRFNPEKKEFSRVYKHASFDLEILR